MKIAGVKKGEFFSGLVLLSFAGFLIREALTMPLGKVSNPGAGFIPLCLGVLLGLFSFLLAITAYFSRATRQEKESEKSIRGFGKNPSVVILSLIGYALIFEKAGFFLATFLLMSVVTHVFKPQKWFITIGFSLLVAGVAYLLFAILLKMTLP
jgi:hypothetical protein